jgi:hypothetical protein
MHRVLKVTAQGGEEGRLGSSAQINGAVRETDLVRFHAHPALAYGAGIGSDHQGGMGGQALVVVIVELFETL